MNNLKPKGIIRKIDDLGRIVIPKEVRREMGIIEGSTVEFFYDKERDGIFLKRYSVLYSLLDIISDIVKSLKEVSGCEIYVTDCSEVIYQTYVPPVNFRDSIGKPLSKEVFNALHSNCITTNILFNEVDEFPILDGDTLRHCMGVAPIRINGTVIGSVIIYQSKPLSVAQLKLAEMSVSLIVSQVKKGENS